jgi:hypothetical protein
MSAHTEGMLEVYGSCTLIKQGGAPLGAPMGTIAQSHTGNANARRLAACWNCFIGFPTEEIEQATSLFDRLDQKEREIIRLRAKALELDEARVEIGRLTDVVLETMQERDQMRAENSRLAIALATALAGTPNCEPGTGDYTEIVRSLAEDVVHVAGIMGVVLTITQRPLLPLAMGNYDTVVDVRESRATYQAREAAARERAQ